MPTPRSTAAKTPTPLGRLYRAVQFAYAPPTLALYQRVRALVGVTQYRTPADPVAALRAAQQVVVDKLTKIARDPGPRGRSFDGPLWRGTVNHEAAVIKGRVVLTPVSDLRHSYPLFVLRLLEQVGLEPLHRCPSAPCTRTFIKVRKKTYCSTRCQQREYAREARRAAKVAA
jgi:hypothetical protein